MQKRNRYILFLLICLTSLTACGPVHRFTRVKKIPREYSLNYNGTEIKAPRSDENKKPWIVFSDQEKNQTFNNPGGKVVAKDVDFLDPFLVIGKKGEFLKLIKYTPDILKNGKLQHKEAEYYGWIHKSKLLLSQQSYTDITTGKKGKSLIAFTDTLLLDAPEKYFNTDSLRMFKDLSYTTSNKGVIPFSIVYRLKESANKKQTLIANRPYVNPEEVKDIILGWIDNSLLQDIGTGLHINYPRSADDSVSFVIRNNNDEILLPTSAYFENRLLSNQYPTVKYNPVSQYLATNGLVTFRTGLPRSIFDKNNNYIFNVNGGRIRYGDFNEIADNLAKINIAFVFEGREQTIEQFPQIVNALQNLQSLFEDVNSQYRYNFSCITNFYDSKEKNNQRVPIMNIGLQPEYSTVMNYLTEKANNKKYLKPLLLNQTWSALRLAVNSFNQHRDATNLIIVIGERGSVNGGFEREFYDQVEQNNCRLLAFQSYAGEENVYNNFVLDIESLISYYADKKLKTKGDILVSPKQVKRNNYYKDVSEEADNSYRLDFPENSITEGYILFPAKGEALPMNVLTTSIDTILQQVRYDNEDVINYIAKGFNEIGNNRTQFDSLYLVSYGMDSIRRPLKKTINSFKTQVPGWYIPTKIFSLSDSINAQMNYKLLLSESEMKELKEFMEALSAIKADYKYQAEANNKTKKEPCRFPDDDLFFQDKMISQQVSTDSIPMEYAGTKKARKNIYKLHLKSIRYCKLCKEKEGQLKKMTLAELQQRITGCPTMNPMLNSIKAKDIKNRKLVTDEQLDELITYYKSRLEELEKAEKIESNGQTYFWVDQRQLP